MTHPSMQHDSGQEPIHLPPPSYWPILAAFSIAFLPVGFLLAVWHGRGATEVLILGALATVICLMGWANSLIRETATLPDIMEDDKWMRMGILLFLVSEAAIFAVFFVHHYHSRLIMPWPPQGAPELQTTLPAIATLILMASSATMQWAHSFLRRGHRRAAGWLTAVTVVLGAVFLGFQGHEWGYLKVYDKFTQSSGTFGTSFYALTGFHGAHVATGIVLLTMVWLRLRLGHFDTRRHFAFVAASWYWHFVDLVWILLFFTIYLIK
jgi:cytochrome c oxidase subunit III